MRAGRYWMRLSRFLVIAASRCGVPQEPRLPPRIEALSRDGGSPYCLISEDPRELWRELKAAT